MSQKTLTLRIVTPEQTIVDKPVRSVRFTGVDGEYGVLANHAPLMTAMKPGPLRYVEEDGDHEDIVLTDGFAEMLNNVLTIVCEAGEKAAEIDVERARAAEQRAREKLAQRGSLDSEQVLRAEAALRRALARQLGARRMGRADI